MAWILVFSMILSAMPTLTLRASAEAAGESAVLNALDYGADPTGATDSTVAIQKALAAAKELEAQGKSVTLEFPKGEYHIYKDKAFTREYHTSNTNSIENPIKTIGFLIEEHENLTIDGKGSLFMMHGNMMALAVVKSENIVLKDFAWDFAVPTVTEMTVTATGSNYTEYYIPACFPYQISGNTIKWSSDLSPYTGQPYWTATGNHNTYAIVTYHPDDEMARNMGTDVSPFTNATSITEVGNNVIRINYSYKNGSQNEHHKPGTVFALCGNAHRETAGAFTWESKNVLAEGVNVHFMHGFGWLIQMSEDVTYRNCNLMPRPNSGHITVSFADGLHASGAKGDLIVENCNFANTHDDPINFHGTFTRVERRIDDHTLQLNYIHTQQGGFPQYHVGDKIAFYTRDTLESSDNEKLYTVAEVISNPGEDGNNLRTMKIRFEEELPAFLTATVSDGTPKYVAENVTYAPAVTIRNNTFKNTATRGILCTTREPVVIEGNTFLNMSMATIFLSNDSGDWYESGPIRDMTIRNNTFYIKTIGDTWWDYKSAIYIHPVTYGNGLPSWENPIHKNITIEGNTFHMSDDTVVKAESVENLVFRNNTILRTDPEFTIALSGTNNLTVGETAALNIVADGMTIIGDNNKNLADTSSRQYDNVFEFTACKGVLVEGNTYDDGMKNYAVIRNMPQDELTMKDEEITVTSNASMPAADAVSDLVYVSSAPDVVSVDASGKMTAKGAGSAAVYAYYIWNGTIVKSNVLTVTVAAGEIANDIDVEIDYEGTLILDSQTPSAQLTAGTDVTWSAADFVSNGSTDVITVSADGTVTAQRNGIAWVKASADGSEDKIPVVVNLAVAGSLADDFRFVREDASHYEIADKSIVITQQGGSDLWTYDNTLKNLLLYSDFDRSDLRTVVKIDGLPVRANNNWDTASFLLYAGDDDYISIGKKGHKNGFATVIEKAQSCSEYEESDTTHNEVTSAYVGFAVKGSVVTMDYKVEGGAWTTVMTTDIDFLGDDYEIGFGAWGNGGHDVTFSQFKVGKASEVTYDELLNEASIALCRSNTAPVIESVAFDADSYQVGDTATVICTCTDAEDDELAQPCYLWSWEGGEAVTRTNTFAVTAEGGLSCTVFPSDVLGGYGAPVTATVSTTSGDANLELKSLRINGNEVVNGAKVLIPADLQKVELAIASLMPAVGTTTVNGTEVENDAVLALDAADTITITRSASGMEDVVYTITLVAVESNCTEIQGIEMPELGLNVTDLSAITWLVTTTESEATLKVKADDRIGRIEVAYGNYREKVALTNNEAKVSFINGLNSYYITVYAKDGITLEQYNINVVYTPDTTAKLQDLKINGETVKGFASDVYEYLVPMGDVNALCVEAVSEQRVRIRIDGEYVLEDAGAAKLELDNLAEGAHEICVVVVADDCIVRTVYKVTFFEATEVKVNLTVGASATVIEPNGNFANADTSELDESIATVSLKGIDGTAANGLSLTPVSGLTDGKYVIVNTRANKLVTNAPATAAADAGAGTGLNMSGIVTGEIADIAVWTITKIDGGYTLQDQNGKYMTISSNNAGVTDNSCTISLNYANGTWTIAQNGAYLNHFGGGSSTCAAGWQNTAAANDPGSQFAIYAYSETPATASTEVTFTGVKAGSTEVLIGRTLYKITVTDGEQPHEHVFGEWTVTKEATCTEPGSKERVCTCGEKETEVIAALGHTPAEAVKENEKAATCTEAGSYDSVVYCSVCQAELSRETVTVPASCPSVIYTDVPVGDWYHEYVDFVTEKGIMNGMGGGLFAPAATTNRAQIAIILYRLAGAPSVEGMDNPFTDVPSGDWYADAVIWAANAGIVKGVDAKTFAPNANVTRAQLVTMFYRYAGSPTVDGSVLMGYTDAGKLDFSTDAFAWAIAEGIVEGLPGNTLDPLGTANRAQIATILTRYLSK